MINLAIYDSSKLLNPHNEDVKVDLCELDEKMNA
jgi:hypothetical protein